MSNCDATLTYNQGVGSIVQQTCAQAACHDGGGFAPGDYRTFNGLSGVLNNGKFNQRVLIDANMPPNPQALSSEDRAKLQCWFDDGFPEN